MVTADAHALFTPLKLAAERGDDVLGGDSFADPPQVFLRLSWVSERPASCFFAFVNKKKSTGAKSGK